MDIDTFAGWNSNGANGGPPPIKGGGWPGTPGNVRPRNGLSWEGHNQENHVAQSVAEFEHLGEKETVKKAPLNKGPLPPARNANSKRPPVEPPEGCDRICQEWRATKPKGQRAPLGQRQRQQPPAISKSPPPLASRPSSTSSKPNRLDETPKKTDVERASAAMAHKKDNWQRFIHKQVKAMQATGKVQQKPELEGACWKGTALVQNGVFDSTSMRAMQGLLKSAGANIVISGTPNWQTSAALQSYLHTQGAFIHVDGNIGKISTQVLQRFLNLQGVVASKLTLDGNWGPHTSRALQRFLNRHRCVKQTWVEQPGRACKLQCGISEIRHRSCVFKTSVPTAAACKAYCQGHPACNIYQWWPQQKFCWFWTPGHVSGIASKADFTCGYKTGGNRTPVVQFTRPTEMPTAATLPPSASAPPAAPTPIQASVITLGPTTTRGCDKICQQWKATMPTPKRAAAGPKAAH